jgi:hypothetical protein
MAFLSAAGERLPGLFLATKMLLATSARSVADDRPREWCSSSILSPDNSKSDASFYGVGTPVDRPEIGRLPIK